MKKSHPGDYTREEKIAMTIAATGADFSAERINQRRQRRDAVRSQHVSVPRPLPRHMRANRTPGAKEKSAKALRHITTCAYCRLPGDELRGPDGRVWHLDHVTPLAWGGWDMPHNLVKACATCNLRKGAKRWTPAPGTLAGDGREWSHVK